MTTSISLPEEIISSNVSWADLSDEEEDIVPQTTMNQWGKPLVIKKELQDKEPEWVTKEKMNLQKNKTLHEKVSDKTIVCRSCKKGFVWTTKEQQWFKEKDFTAPKTCKPCKILFKDCGKVPNHKRRITLSL